MKMIFFDIELDSAKTSPSFVDILVIIIIIIIIIIIYVFTLSSWHHSQGKVKN